MCDISLGNFVFVIVVIILKFCFIKCLENFSWNVIELNFIKFVYYFILELRIFLMKLKFCDNWC